MNNLDEKTKNKIVHDFIIEHFGIEYWEKYQRDIFLSPHYKELYVKARQVGLSFAFSADALARALLFGEQFLITSYSKDEASEKIGYIRDVFLPKISITIPKIKHDAIFTIAFENGGEVKSVPARSVRGRSKNVYADEFEYYKNINEVYRAILPSVVREDNIIRRLRIWSTPLSNDGVMNRIIKNNKGIYNVHHIYWWECSALCNNVKEACEYAPFMETYDRVYKYGTDKLIQQFEDPSMSLDEFRREFECVFGGSDDETFIPLDLLLEVVNEDLQYKHFTSDNFFFSYSDKVRIGMDVGRRNNASEIVIFDSNNRLICNITLKGVSFDVQRSVCEKLFNTLNIEHFGIDGMGIGMNLAEDLKKKYGTIVKVFEFTSKEKDRLASNFKKLVEVKRVELPYDKKLISHIISVKRKVEENSTNPKYYVVSDDAGNNADKFWAMTMAVIDKSFEKAYSIAYNNNIKYRKLRDIGNEPIRLFVR